MFKYNLIFLFILFLCGITSALEPDEIIVIVNGDIEASANLGAYYCLRRNIPKNNTLSLPLGKELQDAISRDQYDKAIAKPVREFLTKRKLDRPAKCLVTTFGIPFKVGPRGPLKDQETKLIQLKAVADEYQKELAAIKSDNQIKNEKEKIQQELGAVQSEIDLISGKETDASVDSELTMVLFSDYELYRWQPNRLNKNAAYPEDLTQTLMISRLDGPTEQIAEGLIDKALLAEKKGLHGIAYIDSRGMADDKKTYSYGHFDQQVRDLAVLLKYRTTLEVKEEQTSKLFEPHCCPQAAIYCGWYSLKKYIDSFEFADGAIGYHIASYEAIDLRDANSTEWCPSMLEHGITVTLGPVAEPYLRAFPNPRDFFAELIDGKCLAEAYWRTTPYCSWQMMLIGDPLYTPYKIKNKF